MRWRKKTRARKTRRGEKSAPTPRPAKNTPILIRSIDRVPCLRRVAGLRLPTCVLDSRRPQPPTIPRPMGAARGLGISSPRQRGNCAARYVFGETATDFPRLTRYAGCHRKYILRGSDRAVCEMGRAEYTGQIRGGRGGRVREFPTPPRAKRMDVAHTFPCAEAFVRGASRLCISGGSGEAYVFAEAGARIYSCVECEIQQRAPHRTTFRTGIILLVSPYKTVVGDTFHPPSIARTPSRFLTKSARRACLRPAPLPPYVLTARKFLIPATTRRSAPRSSRRSGSRAPTFRGVRRDSISQELPRKSRDIRI